MLLDSYSSQFCSAQKLLQIYNLNFHSTTYLQVALSTQLLTLVTVHYPQIPENIKHHNGSIHQRIKHG